MATKKSKKPGMKIRMYRQGLGDCFLVTLPTGNERPFYLMIDCGVVLGTSNPEDKMTAVINDIANLTGSSIDLLVATHEHWDHISAFTQISELISKKLHFDKVWLAWTEDPKDTLASTLREERRIAEKALRMAASHLGVNGSEAAERVDSLVSFFGARAGSTTAALDNIRKLADGKPRYCRPGEPPIAIPGLPGFQFWILGPPRDEKLIKKSNPGKNDAYGLDAVSGGAQAPLITALNRAFGMGAEVLAGFDETLEDPFEPPYCIPIERAAQMPFFVARYFGDATDEGVREHPSGTLLRDQSWRKVDTSWMDGAETMALQLDAATNNTSLVLAIERTDTGEVFLFPGDAQAGNWLSWQKLSWELEDDKGKKRTVTGPELLARTVFYKVGHHGSHNATLKALGLEQMVSDDLCAMIPVDHEMAKKKRWNRMPLPDLVSRLGEKTQGRVLRIDDAAKTKEALAALNPDNPVWKEFASRVDVTDLYYELSF